MYSSVHSYIHSSIHSFIKALLSSLFPQYFNSRWIATNTSHFHKANEDENAECVFAFTMIHNKRRRSADYSLVPFISFAFSNSGLSLRVGAMINYPRAASFRCANSATSCVGPPFATFSSKQITFFGILNEPFRA